MVETVCRFEEGGIEDRLEGYSSEPWPGHRPSINFSHS